MYDLIIIGGGPAGVAAGVYAARKKIKSLLIADGFGGQSLVSSDIQNWIGEQSISGLELAKKLEGHLRSYGEDIEIWDGDLAIKVDSKDGGFLVTTEKGKGVEAQTVLVCSGSRRRRLGIPGEDKLDGKGVAWCATCDAPLFQGKAVAVIGGGNAGLESVLSLNNFADKIYLLHRRDELRGDAVTQEKVKSMEKVTIVYNAIVQEILGDEFVSGLRYKDAKTGEEKTLEVGGVFIEIGSLPNSDLVKDIVKTNQRGEIITDCKTQASSLDGVWAAGDVADGLYKQNNVSVGDAIKAVLSIFNYLHKSN